jgi:thiamine monophosphate synthase
MYRLYVITECWQGRSHADVARAALAGGARAIQLRDKDMAVRELLAAAEEIRGLCAAAGALFVVNDRLDVALAAQADGVHLGPDDMPVAAARRALVGDCPGFPGARGGNPDCTPRYAGRARAPVSRGSALARQGWRRFVIGASVSTVEDAKQAVADGADYLGVGSIFATETKPDSGRAVGPQRLAEIHQAVSLPLVAVGGISADNIAEVMRAGAAGAAVVSAVSRAPDMQAAARELARVIDEARFSPRSRTYFGEVGQARNK